MQLGSTRGFTLIEMMVVIAIAAILAVMGIASLGVNTDKSRFMAERVKMQDLLLRARSMARNRAECISVQVNGLNVEIKAHPTVAGACTPPLAPPVFTAPVVTFIEDVVIDDLSTGNPLIFNSRGGTDYTNPTTTVLHYKAFQSTFTIYPAIGQVRFQ